MGQCPACEGDMERGPGGLWTDDRDYRCTMCGRISVARVIAEGTEPDEGTVEFSLLGSECGCEGELVSAASRLAVLPDEIDEDPEPEPELLPLSSEPYVEDAFGGIIENGEPVEADDGTRYRVRFERLPAEQDGGSK